MATARAKNKEEKMSATVGGLLNEDSRRKFSPQSPAHCKKND
jgi:hypothetical protein